MLCLEFGILKLISDYLAKSVHETDFLHFFQMSI